MKTELERASAFEERGREAAAERLVASRFGTALFNDTLSLIWSLNLLRVEATDASAEELAAEAEELLGAARRPHRRIVVLDEGAGRRLEPEFAELGWKTEAYVFMAHRRDRVQQVETAGVVEVGNDVLDLLHDHIARETLDDASDEVVRQIVEATHLTSRALAARHFAVLVDGLPVSSTDLYSDGRTAQVEDVMTLPDYRGRGFAKAVVSRALEEAWAGKHDFVFLIADARDWPKELYRRLGFEAVGEKYAFLLHPLPE
jgi:ribosomal protein S18 acetylase RimI-like enzyme